MIINNTLQLCSLPLRFAFQKAEYFAHVKYFLPLDFHIS